MTTEEIIQGLRSKREGDAAARELLERLRVLARRLDASEDAVQQVATKFVAHAKTRVGFSVDDLDAYLATSLRNWARSQARDAKRYDIESSPEKRGVTDRAGPAPEERAQPASTGSLRVAVEKVLQPVTAALFEAAQPRWHPELKRVWSQILELVIDGADLEALVARDERVDMRDRPTVLRALNRAYTAHARFRRRLLEKLDELSSTAQMLPDHTEQARHVIAALDRSGVRNLVSGCPPSGDPS
jgi:hypothetical protein